MELTPTLQEAVRRVLHYSWHPIEYKYSALTAEERMVLTEKEFDALAVWAKERAPR